MWRVACVGLVCPPTCSSQTNHLDEAAVAWLVKYLQSTNSVNSANSVSAAASRMTVVVVSHDASFLDLVVTDVLLLAHRSKALEHYRGSYSDFCKV